jgi:hypothetical protein
MRDLPRRSKARVYERKLQKWITYEQLEQIPEQLADERAHYRNGNNVRLERFRFKCLRIHKRRRSWCIRLGR